MSSFGHFISQFSKGFGIIIFRIFSSGLTALQHERVRYLFKAILLSCVVLYCITIPIRVALVILQYIMWRLSFLKLANLLMKRRLTITFFNVFMDAVWYIPLIVLFLSRSLGLFPSTPFDKAIMDQNGSFGAQLLKSPNKQTAFTGTTFLLKRIAVLLLVTVLTFTSRLVPGIRILLSLSILTFLQLRRAIYQIHSRTDGMSITLLTLSLSMLVSNTLVQWLLNGAKLYLTSQALSREFLFPYFCKVTFKMEQKDKRTHQWLLFGFGCAMALCFAVPIFGLILYPVFQMAAVDILLLMLRQNKLSFVTVNPIYIPHAPPIVDGSAVHRVGEAVLVKSDKEHTLSPRNDQKRSVPPPAPKKKSVPPPPPPRRMSLHNIYNTDANIADEMDDMLDDMLCHIGDDTKRDIDITLPSKKKKRKKKAQVLYAEDATRLFKKMNDGKRFKNGIALRKTCNIFAVAWELPEENGRVLPSKVARHFKQVLPTKKGKKLKKTATKAKRGPVSPIPLMQSRSSQGATGLNRAQTVRGHMLTKQTFLEPDVPKKTHALRRSVELPMSNEEWDLAIPDPSGLGAKKESVVSTLESLIAADPNRTQPDDVEVNVIKKKRAGSLTELDLDSNKLNDDLDQLVVKNEVEQWIEEKKKDKLKERPQEPQEPEQGYEVENYFD